MDSEANGGLRDDSEYEHVLEVCLILAKSCPLLRATILKRILRKWPKGYADNEVALLRFLGRVLSDAHALQDLVITRLAGDMTGRVVSCMQSAHVKVLKAAFGLAAPSSRHFFELVKGQPGALGRVLHSMQANCTHWSPPVASASREMLSWYLRALNADGAGRAALAAACTAAGVESFKAPAAATLPDVARSTSFSPAGGADSPRCGTPPPGRPVARAAFPRPHQPHSPAAAPPAAGVVTIRRRGHPVKPHSQSTQQVHASSALPPIVTGKQSSDPPRASSPSSVCSAGRGGDC